MYKTRTEMLAAIQEVLPSNSSLVSADKQKRIQDTLIDSLITTAVFHSDQAIKAQARAYIRDLAKKLGIYPASTHELYTAFGEGKVSGFTIPAINIRALTYDTAVVIFTLLKKLDATACIFEIAKSEMVYTDQRPDEYAVSILAAAIKSGYKGPVFLQGDHLQLSKRRFAEDEQKELSDMKSLIKEAIEAEFFNIDIDASTLVDLTKPSEETQQIVNAMVTARLTTYVRSLQPKNCMISVGGEIGHIGGKNSTVKDFQAFMKDYQVLIPKNGISKVSVQTGSSHGGVPLPDGTIAEVKLDFDVLYAIGEIARNTYHIGGAVQHGASTLPPEFFGEFPKAGTLEIHLATGFQNIVYDNLPSSLKQEVYTWLKHDRKEEWEEGWTEEQFLYKTRKKAIGPFKKRFWDLSDEEKKPIRDALEKQLLFLFEKLQVIHTREAVAAYA